MTVRDTQQLAERTCDGCAEVHPVAAVIKDAYVCAACVLVAVGELHSKRTGINDYMAPYTYAYCVECRQTWPCATAQAMGADYADKVAKGDDPF